MQQTTEISNKALKHHLDKERESTRSVLSTGNKVDLLVDGPATHDALFDAIGQARHHIHLEFYIYKSVAEREFGQEFAQALLTKHRQGVEIGLLYDPVGSRSTPRSFFEQLKTQGIQVLEYHPINPYKIRTKWRPNQRDHRKVVIVDGRITVTGGVDISKHYSRSTYQKVEDHEMSPQEGGWRDVDVRIEGPAVAEFQRLFLETWRSQQGPALLKDYFPDLEKRGEHGVRVVKARPGGLPNPIHDAYLAAIKRAQDSIHLTNGYFMPDEQIAAALRQAADQGVDVALVLPSFSDFTAVIHGQHYHYQALLKAGVKIFERQEHLLHVKSAVIDGVWSTVGSYNLDMRSYLHAEEVNAVVLGKGFAGQMEAMFQDDVRQSRQVFLEEWRRRPLKQRVMERLANQFQYWL